jgi:transcriptional regulator with XRE-family HTH domain
MDIGAMVTKRRGKQSMAEFARSLGVTRQRVWQWEHNDHKPPALIRRKLGIRIRYEMKAVKMAGTGCQHSAQFGRKDYELRP